jgi:hypothetical protein
MHTKKKDLRSRIKLKYTLKTEAGKGWWKHVAHMEDEIHKTFW